MNVRREDEREAVVLVVSGQVDMHTSPELRQHLRVALDGKRDPVVVDLTEVTFIDSSGLATLIEALHGVKRYGGHLRMFGLAPAVKNLFQIGQLDSVFDVRDSREDALTA